MLTVRRAVQAEFDVIMGIYKIAQDFMIRTGNPNQWKHSDPAPEQIEADIENGICHVICEGEEIHGVFALCEGTDPTYLYIEDGEWMNDAPYVAIHRIAGDQKIHGIFTSAMEYCKTYADNIRIDTHKENRVMQRVLAKHGFSRRGTIYLKNGEPRIAFQWCKSSWRNRWEIAYKSAAFYRSEKNANDFWDNMAQENGGGLSGEGHIDLIMTQLHDSGLLNEQSTVLDIGCGGGDYVVRAAEICRHVTALDYSEKMIAACRRRCEKKAITNVSYETVDFMEMKTEGKYDCVLACLNPSTYHPDALDIMLSMTTGTVVYFSMDSSLENADAEPIYCGCNSVRYAEEYLKEMGIRYQKIPYTYHLVPENKEERKIDFAYLVINKVKA